MNSKESIEKCIECGNENFNSKNPLLKVRIPQELFKGYKFTDENSPLKEGIKGHTKCYENMGVFSRHPELKNLSCIDCSSFHGEWLDGDEVLEKCYQWDHRESGHQGVIANDPICNHFSLDYYTKNSPKHEKENKEWNENKSLIAQKTKRGYENLINLLEKKGIIEKVK